MNKSLIFLLISVLSACGKTDKKIDLLQKNSTSSRQISSSKSSIYWDASVGFHEIVNQNPIGACQTFAMIAMLEYIFYYETGTVIDLSEKYMAYSLLKMQAEEGTEPRFGAGLDSVMIDVVDKFGIMPEFDYQWGDLTDEKNTSIHFDIDALKYFDSNGSKEKLSKDEYIAKIDEAFLSPPPNKFIYKFSFNDYGSTKNETKTFKSSKELKDFIKISKDRFQLFNNADFAPEYNKSINLETAKTIISYFQKDSENRKIKSSVVSSAEIFKAVIESLDRHMVVGVTVDVWAGDWISKQVNSGGGGHAMVIVGYQQKTDDVYFKIRNSWGLNKANNGYNYVSSKQLSKNMYSVKLYK